MIQRIAANVSVARTYWAFGARPAGVESVAAVGSPATYKNVGADAAGGF